MIWPFWTTFHTVQTNSSGRPSDTSFARRQISTFRVIDIERIARLTIYPWLLVNIDKHQPQLPSFRSMMFRVRSCTSPWTKLAWWSSFSRFPRYFSASTGRVVNQCRCWEIPLDTKKVVLILKELYSSSRTSMITIFHPASMSSSTLRRRVDTTLVTFSYLVIFKITI